MLRAGRWRAVGDRRGGRRVVRRVPHKEARRVPLVASLAAARRGEVGATALAVARLESAT